MIGIPITLEIQDEIRRWARNESTLHCDIDEVPLGLFAGLPNELTSSFGVMAVGLNALVRFRRINRFLLIELLNSGSYGVDYDATEGASIVNIALDRLLDTYRCAIVMRFPLPNHSEGDMIYGSFAQESWYKAIHMQPFLKEGDTELRIRWPEGLHGFLETDDLNREDGDPPTWYKELCDG